MCVRGRGADGCGARVHPLTEAPRGSQAYLCITKDPGAPVTDVDVTIPSLMEHPPAECVGGVPGGWLPAR